MASPITSFQDLPALQPRKLLVVEQTAQGSIAEAIEQGFGPATYNPPNSDADFMLYKATDGISETELSIITFNLFDRTWSRLFPPTAFDDEVNMAEEDLSSFLEVAKDLNVTGLCEIKTENFDSKREESTKCINKNINLSPKSKSTSEIEKIKNSNSQKTKSEKNV